MQIRSVTSGYSDPAALGKRAEPGEVTLGGAAGAGESRGASAGRPNAAMAAILSNYDVTDITPTEFSEMVQKLYEAGAISQQELQQLTAVRHDMDVDGLSPDDSLDLVEFYQRKVKDLMRRSAEGEADAGNSEALAALLRRLDWVQKFALIQLSPDALGLDAVA